MKYLLVIGGLLLVWIILGRFLHAECAFCHKRRQYRHLRLAPFVGSLVCYPDCLTAGFLEASYEDAMNGHYEGGGEVKHGTVKLP